jgi:formamidopyrimidine-DNA glycosylase
MPELPEVETTVRGINATSLGKKITSFWCDAPSLLKGITPQNLEKALKNKSFSHVSRRGKYIIFALSDGNELLAHMKMTGHFLFGKYIKKEGKLLPEEVGTPLSDPYNRFVHYAFLFETGESLVFCDARKFGSLTLLEKGKSLESLKHLGGEPLSEDFDYDDFVEKLQKRKNLAIKKALLAQEIISGVGNIYADESLFLAKIHPETPLFQTEEKQIKKLFSCVVEVLESGIVYGGDSTSDYRNIYGEKGKHHGFHKVYQKTGQKCSRKLCKGMIQRIVVGGRGTHFCPHCQQKKN